MKSKTFCFNAAVFRKNVVLFWPLWAGYLVLLLVYLPLLLWKDLSRYINLYAANMAKQEADNAVMFFFSERLSTINSVGVIVFVMALITVMALTGYLFSARTSNMMHAFPVTRAELFFTTAVSAFAFMLVPEFAAFLVTVFVCLAYGITCVQYVAVWYLVVATATLLFLAMGMFAAMLTGQILAVPVIVMALNYVYVFVRILYGRMLGIMFYGLSEYSIYRDKEYLFFSPISYFARRVSFRSQYDTLGNPVGIRTEGLEVMGWYCLFAVLMLFAAFLLYRRRPLEKTGDVVAFSALRPVFRWTAGIAVGFGAAFYLGMFFGQAGVYPRKLFLAGLSVIMGLLSFAAAEMLVQKNFRIVSRRFLKEAGVFAGGVLALFAVAFFAGRATEQRIPDREDINEIIFYMSYQIKLGESEYDTIRAIHNSLVSNAKDWKREAWGNVDDVPIRLTYRLKNGKTLERIYTVPRSEGGLQLIARASDFESRPDIYIANNFGSYFEGDHYSTGNFEKNYSNFMEFGRKTADVLLQAMRLDILDGTIQKYNLYSKDGVRYQYNDSRYCGYINFYFPELEAEVYDDMYGDYVTISPYQSFNFGADNVNLLRALMETELIESPDELIFVDDYNYDPSARAY